jgi:nitrate/nitrite-specific signal transduction histidine kinase
MKFLSIALLFFSAVSHSEIVSVAEAINKAGAQSMLSQRIVKNYIMIGSHIKSDKAHKELDQAVALFEQQHLELLDFLEDPAQMRAFNQISKTWESLRLKAISKPSKEMAKELIPLSDKLYIQSNKLLSLLEKKGNVHANHTVSISSKQRMLSQRIAKLYMAMAWTVDLKNLSSSFEDTLKEYESGLAELNKAEENTPAIKKKLKKINAQWTFSKAGLSQYKENRFVPTLISVTTESILKKTDEVTADYQKIAENS